MAWRSATIAAGLALILGLGAGFARLRAQPMPASLIADNVTYDRDSGLLTASGNVEVLYRGRVLKADRVVYDAKGREIRATGPIVLTDPETGVLLAERATLTPDLAAGLVESARLLIADELQLAAAEARRSDGRYATLYRTIASTCTICEGNPTPTWAIRAARVTQDAVARRIYFEDATLELFGIPVGYLPALSIPDPAVRRASGVLVPEIQRSNIYGSGVKIPYYRVLGPSADTTVTPFATTTGAFLLEGEYRRRYASGGFDLSGVIALSDELNDGLGGNPGRGAIASVGAFALRDGFRAEFDLNLVSDDSFLQQYDYSDDDQLTSTARVVRTREHDYFELGTVTFQSLRNDEDPGSIPFILPEFTYRRLLNAPGVGGRLGLEFETLGVWRVDGQDMLRAGGGVDWTKSWTLRNGILATAGAAASFTLYQSWNDPDQPDTVQPRASPRADIELRWPLVRHGARATHLVEPIVQVIYSDILGDQDNPNEDSQLPEFDTTNLFSFNRFPGIDRLETGLRANIGVSYTRLDPAGWSMALTLGRVIRQEADPQFSEGTGLAGRWSDYVAAVSVDFASGLSAVNRALFNLDLQFKRNDFALVYEGERTSVQATYVYLAQDDTNPILGPQPETSEFGFDARYRFRPNWEARALWRYDLATNNNLRATGGLTYGNECAQFAVSVSRRYTSSSNVPPSTSIGFNVQLAGLGGSDERDWPARVCLSGRT